MTNRPELPMLLVSNATRQFNVRVVRQGDRYGLRDCLTHDKAEPLVEFYDRTYIGEEWPRGQFVSRYNLDTLLERGAGGLCLCGYIREWDLPEEAMAVVRNYLRAI